MSEKAVLQLFIPCLLEPLKSLQQKLPLEVQAPHLSDLLTQFTIVKNVSNSQNLERAFFQYLDPEVGELPIAHYRHQIQVNEIKNGLMCADPVHLQVGMNDVTLTQKITDLSDSEAKELIDLLNAHFVQDGLTFIFGSNQCWYVSFDGLSNNNDKHESDGIQSHELDSVLMKNVVGKLVNSTDRNWQVIQNEIQMLLHASEVNQQREMVGLSVVNSVWFWGAGKPFTTKINTRTIYSKCEQQASVLRGEYFAKAANCEWQPLPKDVTLILNKTAKTSDSQIVILDDLFIPALEDNLRSFQQELKKMDDEIIGPLLKAWRNDEFDIVINCCDGAILKPQRIPAWKFWKKSTSLRELSDEISS